ncbi:MAG: UDP-N-acetylglucosamine 2-epimerase (non-hydrolyzing) [Ignavibacteriaceae bacterium]
MKKKKILSIVGARPQFIKYGPLGEKLKQKFDERLLHTGQHYDRNMSGLFFEELNIAEPDINLEVGSYPHGKQTALMLEKIEDELLRFKPDLVIVFGDTNSTLAAALASVKLHIRTAHIEAGLRSFNKEMPEEINRILTDHCSDLLFCPTETAVENLKKENIDKGIFFSGDIMYEAFLENQKIAEIKSDILNKLGLKRESYLLATLHRAENTDNIENLRNIIGAFNEIDRIIILPLHPRTKKIINENNIKVNANIRSIEPVGYLDLLSLLQNCKKVLTDSGGLQKETFFANKFCKTLRNETEWVETLKENRNVLCGTDPEKIKKEALKEEGSFKQNYYPFGDGNTSEKIISVIEENISM